MFLLLIAGFVEQGCSESKVEDDNDAVNEEEWTSSVEAKSNCSDDDAIDLEATAEVALKKLLSCSLEEFEKRVSGECDSSAESMKNESTGTSETFKRPLHKGNLFELALHSAFIFFCHFITMLCNMVFPLTFNVFFLCYQFLKKTSANMILQ